MKIIINGQQVEIGGGSALSAGTGITIENGTINVTTPTVPILQSEYDALNDEEKDGKLYLITDTQSEGTAGGGVTMEQVNAAIQEAITGAIQEAYDGTDSES